MYQLSDVAECNLGKVKLKPTLSAAVSGGHAWGFAFRGFVAVPFWSHSPNSVRVTLVSIPLIYQCDRVGWLPLSGLPWTPASLACITHGSNLTKAPSPSSSIGNEFNG